MDKNTDLYRGLFSGHPHATVLFGLADGVILDVNEAALAMYGYGREVGVAVLRDMARAPAVPGGLARDLDGLLTAIVGLTKAAPARKELDEIRSLSLRASKLAHRLLEA